MISFLLRIKIRYIIFLLLFRVASGVNYEVTASSGIQSPELIFA